MGASPKWKVYDHEGTYQAATKEIEAAAAVVSFYGRGATIKLDHKVVVWTEGVDGDGDSSYDEVAEKVAEKIEALKRTLPPGR
jgi:hypothetical protein